MIVEPTGTAISLVYVGEECLLKFPTDQQAWEYLSRLSRTADESGESWPEEVYIAFVLEESDNKLLIPQINKIVKKEGKLKLRGLYGSSWDEFCQRIIDDWPNIS
jgi:hypothetical protein